MKTSTTVKILLAIFLGAFLWFVIISIQTPRRSGPTNPREGLREELAGRSENVTFRAGDVTIEAKVQETFRNGEVHYRDFAMTQDTETRTVRITGDIAQTRARGTEVDFVEMQGNIEVETSDGLTVWAPSLNYESAKRRIFSNEATRFTLKELSGRCDRFLYFVDDRLLDLQGDVRCRMDVTDSEPGEAAKAHVQRTNYYGQRLVFDQKLHTLQLEGDARIAQAGSFVVGERIEAELTDDNRQFTNIHITRPTARQISNETKTAAANGTEDPLEPAADETPDSEVTTESHANLSYHSGGIKDLRAQELQINFTAGGENLLSKVNAVGEAELDIAPTSAQIAEGKTEIKKIRAHSITCSLGDDGRGIKNLLASSEGTATATVEIAPLKRAMRRARKLVAEGAEDEPRPPRTMHARRFNVTVDPQTNEFTFITMSGDAEFIRSDLQINCDNIRYDTQKEQMQVNGSPVLQDSTKRVTANSMVVSLIIGDLAAEGDVQTIFYPPSPEQSGPAIFAIGAELDETTVSSGSLRLDYRNNVMRFRDGVRVSQGGSLIQSQSLDIFQKEERLIAKGKVAASLLFNREEEEEGENGEKEEKEEGSEDRSGQTAEAGDEKPLLSISGDLLTIDKARHELRVENNAQTVRGELTLIAAEIRFELSENDALLNGVARNSVSALISGITVTGDLATLYTQKQLLVVEGRVVRYLDPANNMESTHRRMAYDLASGALRMDARADQMVKTLIGADGSK